MRKVTIIGINSWPGDITEESIRANLSDRTVIFAMGVNGVQDFEVTERQPSMVDVADRLAKRASVEKHPVL